MEEKKYKSLISHISVDIEEKCRIAINFPLKLIKKKLIDTFFYHFINFYFHNSSFTYVYEIKCENYFLYFFPLSSTKIGAYFLVRLSWPKIIEQIFY